MDSLLYFFLQDYFSFCLLFQAEVIDVSYGNADDLKRIQKMKNTTNQIALLKLGKLPLLYKVGPMAVCLLVVEWIFWGFLTYMPLWVERMRERDLERERKRGTESQRVSQEDDFAKIELFKLKSLYLLLKTEDNLSQKSEFVGPC